MTKDEALKLALEALEYASTGNRRPEIIGPAITAVKEALAQPERPAPCERHCEANAFKVTIRNLNGEFDRLMEKHNALHVSARRHRDANARLMQAIQKTIDDNGHLADGDNCTLIDLANAVKEHAAQPEEPEGDIDFWIRAATEARQAEMKMRREIAKPQPKPLTVDCIGLALDLEKQSTRVESQTVERAMKAAAHGLRLIDAAHIGDKP